MGAIVDKALSMWPAYIQRIIVVFVIGFMLAGVWYNLTASVAGAQTQIQQLQDDGKHRDGRLDRIEELLNHMAVGQGKLETSNQDMQKSLERIEDKIDADNRRKPR